MRWRIPKYFPGWFVSGGGGSGGSGTVQTDGVTIQGDGSAGNKIAIKAVQTNATLSGAGTVASKLAVAPLTAYANNFVCANAIAATANTITLAAFSLPWPVTFSQLSINLFAADAVNNADFGWYNSAGTLIFNIGAQIIATTGDHTIATVQGSLTLLPGVYFAGYTSNGSSIAPNVQSGGIVLYFNGSFGASAGGALPASITAPALAPRTFNQGPFCFALS